MHSNFLTTYTDLIYEGSRLGGKLTSAAKIINYWTELLKNMGFVFNFEYSDKSLAESATDFRLKYFSGDKQNFAFFVKDYPAETDTEQFDKLSLFLVK
ncbi:MAG: hypothetical protein VZQ51_10000, partial [Bacteroidales bacterium]|nr:hypothetical protein [Bacteroidales bacterium]